MIQEQFVSLETARLLKQKGFDEICNMEYGYEDGKGYVLQKWIIYDGEIKNSQLIEEACTAPSQSLAMRWLREEKQLFIEVATDIKPSLVGMCFRVGVYDMSIDCLFEKDNIDTYEDACEYAIKYCLERLL